MILVKQVLASGVGRDRNVFAHVQVSGVGGGGRIVPSRRIAFAAALLSGYSVQCRSMILA